MKKSAATRVKKSAGKPVGKPAGKVSSKPVTKPVTKPASKVSSKSTSKPVGKPVGKVASRPAAKPASKLASKPAAMPASKLASKPAAKLATKAASKPTRQVLCLAVLPKAGLAADGTTVSFPLYWICTDGGEGGVKPAFVPDLAAFNEVLVDPLLEELWCAQPEGRGEWAERWRKEGFAFWAERQFQPGVTDNLARTVKEALVIEGLPESTEVASGTGFLFPCGQGARFASPAEVESFGRYRFFHPLTDRFAVHDLMSKSIATENFLSFPAVHRPDPKPPQTVRLDLTDQDLERLSRERLLALSLAEMKAIRAHYEQAGVKNERQSRGLPEWPTDVELEIIAQTWSEHCKHKIFNATIHHTDYSTGQPVSTVIKSLFKTCIAESTRKIKPHRGDLLSVFKDNAGVMAWDSNHAVCFKVETHNSPSALEPYGGALTGILGVNRDILGTGLGARPILNTDVFCFAYPTEDLPRRPKLLPPEAILDGVRKGVEDGGNKSGIPTVNGAVYFHPGYRAKPLVFCGTVGIMPLSVEGNDAVVKHTLPEDTIVMAGGRVGADGVHGATFSSEALHEGSPVSAVQIGDPFTQKRLLEFVIEARDAGLITGITDNGAGGLSSSVGEMACLTGGATLEVGHVPLKYPGLADWEIVVSESQERMTISTRNFAALARLAAKHNVEVADIGTFHDRGYFEVTRDGKPIALIDLHFLHHGVPVLELESEWTPAEIKPQVGPAPRELTDTLIALLSHPNISSRETVIRQYDHEVQGMSLVKPLMGPFQQAPCDAAVVLPVRGEPDGLAVSNGLCPHLSRYDPYLMALCAVDEAVRNAVCVGADPGTLVMLDNFCWPDPIASRRNPDGKNKLGQLVRACQALADISWAYGIPFISGKDSMKNDFDDGVVRLSIPPTLLVSAMGKVRMSGGAVTMEFKQPGDAIYLIAAGSLGLAGSHYEQIQNWSSDMLPALDISQAKRMYTGLHKAIMSGLVKSCHDLSEGGLGVALAECVIGSKLGARIEAEKVVASAAIAGDTPASGLSKRMDVALFGEGPARVLVTIDPLQQKTWEKFWEGFTCVRLGFVEQLSRLRIISAVGKPILDMTADGLCNAWKTRLPFAEEMDR